MVDSTISRVRMHDLTGLGRSGLMAADKAGSREACASPQQALTGASSRAEGLPRRPKPPSSRPEANDLMASTI
jgi:hypothetical protein